MNDYKKAIFLYIKQQKFYHSEVIAQHDLDKFEDAADQYFGNNWKTANEPTYESDTQTWQRYLNHNNHF